MEPNTPTTIRNLNRADRFYFPSDKNKIVYEITAGYVRHAPKYNIINGHGHKQWTFDKQCTNIDKPVIFLRNANAKP